MSQTTWNNTLEVSEPLELLKTVRAKSYPVNITHYSACMHTYHITFLSEDSIVETLRSHPFHRELDGGVLVLPEVVLGIDVFRESKV